MNRRNILVALSAASVPMLIRTSGIAYAQGTAATTSAPASAAAGQPLTVDQHKQMTLLVGSLSKQASELALTRATKPRVKEFAGFENAEQLTIAQVLTDEINPAPFPLDSAHAAMLQSLSSKTGAEFDRAYVALEIQGHDQLLQIQQGFLHAQPSIDTDPVHVAMLARTVIQMHLTMLQTLRQLVSA